MKQLETQFVQDNNNFTQVKRTDKAAIYKRETLEGQFVSYEVFAIMSKNGAEIYPNKLAFGRGALTWAWCPIAEDRANIYFDRMNNGDVPIPQIDPETGEIINNTTEVSLEETPEVTPAQPVVSTDDPTAPTPTPEVLPTPDGGAVVTVAKVTKTQKVIPTYVFPNKTEWLRDDFAELNGMDHHPAHSDSYGPLMALVKAGKVKEVKKALVGKGRPRSFYSVVATPATV